MIRTYDLFCKNIIISNLSIFKINIHRLLIEK